MTLAHVTRKANGTNAARGGNIGSSDSRRIGRTSCTTVLTSVGSSSAMRDRLATSVMVTSKEVSQLGESGATLAADRLQSP